MEHSFWEPVLAWRNAHRVERPPAVFSEGMIPKNGVRPAASQSNRLPAFFRELRPFSIGAVAAWSVLQRSTAPTTPTTPTTPLLWFPKLAKRFGTLRSPETLFPSARRCEPRRRFRRRFVDRAPMETEFRLQAAFPKRFANFGNEKEKDAPIPPETGARATPLTSFPRMSSSIRHSSFVIRHSSFVILSEPPVHNVQNSPPAGCENRAILPETPRRSHFFSVSGSHNSRNSPTTVVRNVAILPETYSRTRFPVKTLVHNVQNSRSAGCEKLRNPSRNSLAHAFSPWRPLCIMCKTPVFRAEGLRSLWSAQISPTSPEKPCISVT